MSFRVARALLPWLVVVGFTMWAARPMLTAGDSVFAGRLATDNVVTPWFYDLTARSLDTGRSTDWLWGLRHPRPLPRAAEFPSDWDARLVAPLMSWSSWPRSWGLVQTAALLLNGLGAALLARGLGARGVGIAIAGILGILCRPVWKDLVMARMNAAFPGLALGALGAWLWTLQGRRFSPGPAALAVVLGIVSTLVYPPFVALLVPFGVVLGMGPLGRAPWKNRVLAVAVVGLVAVQTLPSLAAIAAPGMSKVVACQNLACPTAQNAVTWDRLFLWTPDWREGLSASGSAAASLLLWPMVVFWRQRRTGVVASLVAVGFLFLALGPCASWSAGRRVDWSALPFGWNLWVGYLSCKLEPIHDYNRLATIALCVAGALGGVGVESAWATGRRGSGVALRRGILAVLTIAVLGAAQWLVLSESLAPTKWHRADPPATALHIRSTEASDRGLVLELPFDRSAQFLSILAEPSVPRGNPLRPGDAPPGDDVAWKWAYALGNGTEVVAEPSQEQVAAAGIRWVYWDEDRCANASPTACSRATVTSLRRVLGAPQLTHGLLVWSVEP